jgi:hypothetical protein
MSATITVPKGLDTLDASERALLDSMRADEAAEPAEAAPEPRATAAVAPEPEPVEPEIEIDDDGAPQPSRMVPHAQFHAANERRKAAEAKAREAETKLATEMARLQERFGLITQLVESQTTAPPAAPALAEELPDVAVDPVGHFKALYDRTQKELGDVKSILTGFQESQQQSRAVQELRNWGMSQEMAFEAQEPAYRPAMEHLRASRHEELEAIGVTNPTERERIIANDITAIAQRARVEGANFAERLFRAAEKRGFKKAAPAAAAADPAIPPLDAPAAARIDTVQRGRDNSTSIGSLGSAPAVRMSVEKIANMNDRDFAVLLKKMEGNPTALRDLMGH